MTVDQDAERSMLERKERADLVTMAKALGEKPPARAKKADIVDLILRVTNVESNSAAASEEQQESPATGRGGRPTSATSNGATPADDLVDDAAAPANTDLEEVSAEDNPSEAATATASETPEEPSPEVAAPEQPSLDLAGDAAAQRQDTRDREVGNDDRHA